jgi:serine/threonine protein kinase
LLGDPALSVSKASADTSVGGESMTGGVGTTFYRAPEQEGVTRYTIQADIFSLGVILFEMFHPPFTTYMERAETLTTLRGDKLNAQCATLKDDDRTKVDFSESEFNCMAADRFPKSFLSSVPKNAQRYVHRLYL